LERKKLEKNHFEKIKCILSHSTRVNGRGNILGWGREQGVNGELFDGISS
jgi:hypothetical protein